MTYLYTIINKIVAESVDKMISVKEECLRINSANLVYYETGNSDIPILFLHGNSSNSFIFDKMYKYFERKYRYIKRIVNRITRKRNFRIYGFGKVYFKIKK